MAPRKTSKAAHHAAAETAPDAPAPDLSARDVADGENETRVVAPGDAGQGEPEAAPLTEAQHEAIAAHLELRVAEMTHYVRTEAHKHGMDPHAFASLFADQLHAGL